MESKAILAGLLFRINEKNIFKKMNSEIKSEITLELKILIDCFECTAICKMRDFGDVFSPPDTKLG